MKHIQVNGKVIIGELTKIVDNTSNEDHLDEAHGARVCIELGMIPDQEKMLEFINEAQEYL